MKPSAYDETLAKDAVVEHRDQVKVTFAGGNVFHIQADGVDVHEVRRGSDAAWKRAEALRLDLNPDYAGPPPSDQGETTDTQTGEGAGAATDAAPPQDKPEEAPKPEKPEEPAKPEPKAKPAKSKDEEPDGGKRYVIGDAEGEIRLVPVDVVTDLLADQMGRVGLLQGSDEARRLSRRVRATDGRCAPIFLTKKDPEDRKETPALFDGLYTLACAINLGMSRVAVVILPSGKVGSAQGYISALMRASLSADGSAEEDELMYRANSDD